MAYEKHFYDLKNPCTNKSNLELTEAIKVFVLENQRYYPERPTQTINNYNMFCNLIGHLDFTDKIGHLLSYQSKQLTDVDDHL